MKAQPRLLAAYRFSSVELEKMNGLKSIFEKNGYAFDPNRFPEVYYADFEEVEDLIPEKHREYIVNPDALGYYFDFFHLETGAGNDEKFGDQSEEGKIILFKDRIEAFCARNPSTSEEGVRFVVLMHELGHWTSHWAQFSGKRWIYGYQFSNRFTEEALAQLIAYWCCNGDPLHEKTLHILSPKDSLGKVDPSQVYGAYEPLKRQSPVDVLIKLAQLRDFWMVKDEKMLQFLNSDFVDMVQWIEATRNREVTPVWKDFVGEDLGEWLMSFRKLKGWGESPVYDTLELGEDYIKSSIDFGIL